MNKDIRAQVVAPCTKCAIIKRVNFSRNANMSQEAYLVIGWTLVTISLISIAAGIVFVVKRKRAEAEHGHG